MPSASDEQLRAFDESTRAHVLRVSELLGVAIADLMRRAFLHDQSKFSDEERETFSSLQGLLKADVNTPEYARRMALLGAALQHHYRENDHHPEHFPQGVADMTLPAMVEMLCDWRAAWLDRADESSFRDSFRFLINDRFRVDTTLARVLFRTCEAWGWFDEETPAWKVGRSVPEE